MFSPTATRVAAMVAWLVTAPAYAQEAIPVAQDVEARLAAVATRSTLQVTTSGRKTGNPHTVTVWFLVEGPTVYLVTLNLQRDWPRNVRKNPQVALAIGDLRLKGRATPITDPARFAHVVELTRKKYWIAWLGSWFGSGPEGAFAVQIDAV